MNLSCQWEAGESGGAGDCGLAKPDQLEKGWGCPLASGGDARCECINLFDQGYLPLSALNAGNKT